VSQLQTCLKGMVKQLQESVSYTHPHWNEPKCQYVCLNYFTYSAALVLGGSILADLVTMFPIEGY